MGPKLNSIFPHTMEVNGIHQLFGYPYSSKYFVCVCVQLKKEIHTGLEQLWVSS